MLLYFLTCDILHIVLPGVSIKIEEASSLGRVTDCINKGPLVPFSRGGEGGGVKVHSAPENFELQKNVIFSVLGTKFENKRTCFSFKKMYLSIYQSHNQFVRAMNK